jgi:phosphatidate cytidylyltransferase
MTDKNRNLVLRVASAALLLPAALWVTWRGDVAFAVVCALAAVICAGEVIWMFERRLAALELYGLAVAGMVPLVAWLAASGRASFNGPVVLLAVAAAVLGLLALGLGRSGPLEPIPRTVSVVTLSWLYAGLLVAVVEVLRERFGFGWVVLAFAVTWMNDTFAYFAGRAFGRHKLAERISPKKTWEGFAGGLLGSVGGAVLVARLMVPELAPAAAVALGAGGAVLGPMGDLCESMLKRAAGVKDSGKLIPGHGGLLDRIDALLFVAPWVLAFATFAALRPA